MHRRPPFRTRSLAWLLLGLQLVLHSVVAWGDARHEGDALGQQVHVEAEGARHAETAHAPDCAISQHLQAPLAPAPRSRPIAVLELATAGAPGAAAPGLSRWRAATPPSRAPPAVV